jgi:hypothetical protein
MAAPIVEDGGTSILDLTSEERAAFGQNVEHGLFRTVLFRAHDAQPFLKSHLIMYPQKIIGPDAGKGEVFALRDSYLAVNPKLCEEPEHRLDPRRFFPREQMAYQYVENNIDMTEEDLERKFQDWSSGYFGRTRLTVLKSQTWPYFRRFNQEGILRRAPWRVLGVQGRNLTLFVHASTFFESVLDIVNYNNMLLEGLSGKFSERIDAQASADHKPVPKNPFSLFILLTPILVLLWALIYLLMLPLNSLIFFPLQRWYLLTAFKTEDVGPWYRYSLAHFTKVSVRFLRKGDDPIVVKLAEAGTWEPGRERFPGIHQPKFSLNWNSQDYRIMIAEWQRLIQPTFLDSIGPHLRSVANWLRLHFPGSYSYFASWTAIFMFSHLTGFSYRKEDKRGGGCYVPKCSLLAQARKEYGEEIGNRVCTHSCKLLTEELLRSKGLDMTLEPNLRDGSCMIRGGSPRINCCSDNSLYEW